ncbi:IS21 family transposase [Streptomyces sp. HUAS TT20]|uniref:IS21 family transposase n=1 Tax=Streptomyces sp. HUAS TT20 TaxID=3447509 RepID=UPI0021D89A7E|nr:IS21 family transposase [Streptomyces sp. HUAS 15-9]UXY25174.1 IS21 family transposase [Streptomyces sp. HUAS 15-9]
MSLSKQELFDRIRRDSWQRQLSIRALSKKYGVHRRLVREALSSPVPTPRRRAVRTSPRMEPYKKTVDAWLRADLEAPCKQRHTVRRIVARIEEEFGEAIPYPTVRDFVAARRTEIAAQAGAPVEAFVTRHNALGADAEVDFGDVYVDLAGQRTRCYLFAFRLAYSGKSVHRISRSCGQQAFFEGHVHALTTLGGVPTGQVRYDNLTPAVKKVVFRSRSREENPRWTNFHEYYGFTPFYCEPGLRGAHEKGGVEGQVGYFRRNYLTPVPQVDSVDELNTRLAEFEAKEDERRIGARMRTIAQDFAREADHLLPLPDDPFATGITLTPRVDRYGMITVKMCRYSVPVRFIDRKVTVTLTCDDLTVYDGRREIARHRRLTGRGAEHLVLDHYLEALLTKPGALERSEALHQARAGGTFTAVHEAFWAAAKKALGDIEGTKALVKVLLLHRHQQHADVVTGIRAALVAGTFNEDVIALEARKAAQAAGRAPTVTASPLAPEPLELDPAPVTPLTSRRLARALPSDQRPLPRLEQWDELLQLRRKDSS